MKQKKGDGTLALIMSLQFASVAEGPRFVCHEGKAGCTHYNIFKKKKHHNAANVQNNVQNNLSFGLKKKWAC